MPSRWLMNWFMNQVFLLTSKARTFATEVQDDKQTVILNEVKNLAAEIKRSLAEGDKYCSLRSQHHDPHSPALCYGDLRRTVVCMV